MDIIPDKKRLSLLVNMASKGEIVLPEFQRNFVWRRDDITDLLTSIIKKYFIGTFLFLRVDRDNIPFAMRPITGVDKSEKELNPEWMVLDGQQRITSLYYVFHAPNIPLKSTRHPYRFFLNLKKITNGEIDDAIFSERSDYCDEYLEEKHQFENWIIPFTEILNWSEWRHKFETYWLKNDKDFFIDQYHPKIEPVWEEKIKDITSFQVPTIEIPKVEPDNPDKIAEVCAIFEKMNSTGVPLSVYDLLTARLYKDKIDLHKLWTESIEEHGLLCNFSNNEPDIFGVIVLRTIALMRGKEVKSKVLINLKPEEFEQDWKTCAYYVEKALQRITSTNEDGFGVFDKKWFPYTTMTTVLAALLQYLDSNPKYTTEGLRAIKKWYWASVFLERYAGATDSTTYSDYNDIIKYLKDPKKDPSFFKEASEKILNNPNFSLKDISRRNAVYKGIMSLIAIKGAKDFMADDSIEFWDLDDHHIFPKKYLVSQKKYTDDEINTVLNKTLISSSTNRKISKTPPSIYIKKIIPQKSCKIILDSHYINEKAMKAMMNDNYEEFLEAREKELVTRIRDLLK
jgi:hypothetical protein